MTPIDLEGLYLSGKVEEHYLCLALLVNVTKQRTSYNTSIHVRAGPQFILLPAMADSRAR